METTTKLVGVYAFLAAVPLWITTIVLYFLCIGVLYLGRDIFEGLPYNIAFSSVYGDWGLIGCMLIGVTILQEKTAVPVFIASAQSQIAVAVIAVAIGVVAQIVIVRVTPGAMMVMDSYHSLVVVPLVIFLLVMILPLVFVFGSVTQKVAVVVLIIFWALLVVVDVRTGRLPQQQWLYDHAGVSLPAWEKKK